MRVSSCLFWILLLAAVVIRVAPRAGYISLPDYSSFLQMIGMNPLNASGLAGTAFLFLCARPNQKSFVFTLILGCILETYYLTSLPPGAPWHYRLMVSGPGLAIAGIFGLSYLAVFAPSEVARTRARAMFRLAAIYLLYPVLVPSCFAALSALTPQVYDAFGYTVEGSLGFWPSNEVAMFIQEHPGIDRFLVGIYTRLPVFVMLAYTLNLLYEERCYSNVFYSFIASGTVAWLFYPLLPMVGVDQYLGVPPFPSDRIPLEVPQELVVAPANLPRTCFPSMHTTWILLPFFTVRRIHPLWNCFFGLAVLFTLISTMHTKVGHYFIDLIPSVPFAVAFMAILARPTNRNGKVRLAVASLCLSYVVLMALSIRYFSSTLAAAPHLTWSIFGVGVVGSLWAESFLASRSLPEKESAG